MSIEQFLRFLAFMLFAAFGLYWQPKYSYAKYRYVPFVLIWVGVIGAAFMMFGGVEWIHLRP